jgi:hypothetical protein
VSDVTKNDQGFLLSGSVQIDQQFVHERQLKYQPGRSLEIHDRIQSIDAVGPYASQLLPAPDLEPELQDNGFSVTVDGLSLKATLLSPNCRLDMARGQKTPPAWMAQPILSSDGSRDFCAGHLFRARADNHMVCEI